MSVAVDFAEQSVKDRVSAEEWDVRVDLAAAYRLVDHYGWDDLVFTHLSARVPGPEHHFLINPFGMMFGEIRASDLVKIDLEGNIVLESPYQVNKAGFVIHSAIHMGRDSAHCVLHLHTDQGEAVSAQKHGLLPLTQRAMLMGDDIAYHDYEGVAVDMDERERLVKDLGDKHNMILRNHGTLTVGETVAEAFVRMYMLERACKSQVMALAGNTELNMPPEGAPEKTAKFAQSGDFASLAVGVAWPALLRMLDREDSSYRS